MWRNGQERKKEAQPQQGASQEQDTSLVVSRLEDELKAEQRKSEEYLDLLRRSQADFVNYKRRVGQEQSEVGTTAQIELLHDLLPVLDDLGRALTSAPPELAEQPWVQGLRLVAKRLGTLFEERGIRVIGKEGERFDPRWHEAVALGTQADAPEGTILQVVKPGYIMGERIVRPAQVVVAGAMSPTTG